MLHIVSIEFIHSRFHLKIIAMSIQNAMTFIKNVETNIDLRKACYQCKSRSELLEMLDGEDLAFNEFEFSEAVNVMLFKCQTYEQADCVKQTELWFSLFR